MCNLPQEIFEQRALHERALRMRRVPHAWSGASLITAYHNSGGDVDMEWALTEMVRRGRQVPGGSCGNWGACGAGINTAAGDYLAARELTAAE